MAEFFNEFYSGYKRMQQLLDIWCRSGYSLVLCMWTCELGGSAAVGDDAERNGVGGSSFINTSLSVAESHIYSGQFPRLVHGILFCEKFFLVSKLLRLPPLFRRLIFHNFRVFIVFRRE